MTGRLVWLAAGAAAGAFATVKGRRAAYRLSVPGLVDQAAALGAGWREFTGEVATGMAARTDDLRTGLDPSRAPLTGTAAAHTAQTALDSTSAKDRPTP